MVKAKTPEDMLRELSDKELLLMAPQVQSLRTYCPHEPWPKQQEFLDLDCREAFYGGAAGPGKSDALLMGALQYVHVPQFSALLLRKDYQRLSLSGGLIPRSHDWLANTDARWNGSDRRWTFPSGASIQFGYLDSTLDKFRYGSSEYQYIGFDELTEFREEDYTFLFSRLRKTIYFDVPMRIRSASNPGGSGHNWVLDRFFTKETLLALQAGERRVFWNGDRACCPALIRDNPAIDEEEYRQSLMNLPAVTRERLMNGDWSIREQSVVNASDLRYYTMRGSIIVPDINTQHPVMSDERMLRRFATIDTAGTSKQKAAEAKGKNPSWSVCAIWDYWREVGLFLRWVWRGQVGWPALRNDIKAVLAEWGNPIPDIENAHHGQVLHAELKGSKLVPTKLPGMTGGQDIDGAKYDRAVASGLLRMIERHQFFLPDVSTVKGAASWMPEYEAELLSWTGHPDETADQIDVSSYAAYHVENATASWGGPVGNTKRVGARF